VVRRASKVDANQKEVVERFEAFGCSVLHLHTVGQGCPDLLVGISGVNVLVEIKDGGKVESKQKLSDKQVEWHEEWRGRKVEVVKTIADVLELVNRIRSSK